MLTWAITRIARYGACPAVAKPVTVSSVDGSLELGCPTLPLYTVATLQPQTLQCLYVYQVCAAVIGMIFEAETELKQYLTSINPIYAKYTEGQSYLSAWRCFLDSLASMWRQESRSCWQHYCAVKGTRQVVLITELYCMIVPPLFAQLSLLQSADMVYSVHSAHGILPLATHAWSASTGLMTGAAFTLLSSLLCSFRAYQ